MSDPWSKSRSGSAGATTGAYVLTIRVLGLCTEPAHFARHCCFILPSCGVRESRSRVDAEAAAVADLGILLGPSARSIARASKECAKTQCEKPRSETTKSPNLVEAVPAVRGGVCEVWAVVRVHAEGTGPGSTSPSPPCFWVSSCRGSHERGASCTTWRSLRHCPWRIRIPVSKIPDGEAGAPTEVDEERVKLGNELLVVCCKLIRCLICRKISTALDKKTARASPSVLA